MLARLECVLETVQVTPWGILPRRRMPGRTNRPYESRRLRSSSSSPRKQKAPPECFTARTSKYGTRRPYGRQRSIVLRGRTRGRHALRAGSLKRGADGLHYMTLEGAGKTNSMNPGGGRGLMKKRLLACAYPQYAAGQHGVDTTSAWLGWDGYCRVRSCMKKPKTVSRP